MSNIRVTRTGLIAFVVGLSSVFTGFIFTLIVTRQLTPNEFGTWSIIGVLIGYVLMLGPVTNYWNTREIARGVESGKTGFLSSNIFSVIAVLIYLIIAYFYTSQGEIDEKILFFAAILIPTEFIRNSLAAIAGGYKPQKTEYGFIAFETSKIPIALILVYFLEMGLEGIIISTTLASIVNIIVIVISIPEKLKGKFQLKFLKKWLKLSLIPTYPNLRNMILDSDIIVFSVLTGSLIGIAYWSAAKAISRTVRHSIKINVALYPKLLAGGRKEYLEENLIKFLYFAFPLSALSITFAKPGMFALNPLYQIAFPIIIFMVPIIFVRQLGALFETSLLSLEKVDVNENSTFKDYLKSKLFYLPTLGIIQRSGYIVSLFLILMFLISSEHTDVDLVIYWSIIGLAAEVPYTAYLYRLVRKEFSPRIDKKALAKYFGTSIIIFGLVYILMDEYLVYKESIFEFLPELVIFLILGVGGYLAITYLIDKRTRTLFNAIINEIKQKKGSD